MIRVLIVDDQELVRTGLRMIVESEPDLTVVGEAGDGLEAVEMAAALQPDVTLMDIRMPKMDGIEATRRLADAKVLILTTFELDEYVVDALRAGASGFLLKDVPGDELIHAIRVVAAGEALLAPSVTRRLLDRFAKPVREPDADARSKLASLTQRESEVLTLVARGLSNSEIAAELFLGETTVKSHVSHVLMKLALRDRVQAVVFAYETGLIQAGS